MDGDVQAEIEQIVKTIPKQKLQWFKNLLFLFPIYCILYSTRVGWKNTPRDSVQSVHNSIQEEKKLREWDHKYQIEQTPPYNNGFESNSKVEAKAASSLSM